MTRQAAQRDRLTVAEAADYLGWAKQRVYEAIEAEQIEHYRYPRPDGTPGTIRIERAELDRFLAACKRPAIGRAS